MLPLGYTYPVSYFLCPTKKTGNFELWGENIRCYLNDLPNLPVLRRLEMTDQATQPYGLPIAQLPNRLFPRFVVLAVTYLLLGAHAIVRLFLRIDAKHKIPVG